MRVAVIGGGINGFACATRILEHLKTQNALKSEVIEVTVISDQFSPNTTGDGSAGLWGPYLLGGTPIEKVHKWSKVMHDFLEELWLSKDAGEAGVCLIPAIRLTTAENVAVFWQDIVYGCVPLPQQYLDELNSRRTKKFTGGMHFVTYTSEPVKLLPYLMKRFKQQGGRIKQEKIENLDDFIDREQYDVVVNCTGLGSQQLLNDTKMLPVRGQVSRVKANWVYCVIMDSSDDGNYIIPNSESVVLGGTHQEHDYNTNVCPVDKRLIIDGCQKIVPGLYNAQHLYDWVGLRPGRSELCLEVANDSRSIVVHNYGHGGSGVTLAWGCAEDVLELIKNEINARHLLKSKL